MASTTTTTSKTESSYETLKTQLRSLTYAVDHTGTSPANKVIENRTLSDANGENYRHVIPKAAPFFAESVRIFHTQTNDELIRGQDFYCVGTFIKAVTNVVNHQRIAWCIIFDDPRISGEYRIEYQTIGGEFVLDEQQMAEVLANYLENPRLVDWETVVGRPLTFPPLPHDVEVTDTTGWDGVIRGEEEIRDAILALIRDEEEGHPGYSELLSDMLRLHNRLESFDGKLDEYKTNALEKLNELKSNLGSRIDKVEGDLTAQEQSLVGLINAAKTDLTGLVGTKVIEITNNYTTADAKNLTTAKTYTDSEVTKAKTYTDQRDTAIATELRSKDKQLEDTIRANDVKQTNSVSTAKTDLTSALNAAVAKLEKADAATLTSSKAYTDSKVSALRSDVENLVATSNNVNQAVTTAINSAKTSLQAAIDKEIADRKSADNTISTNLSSLRSDVTRDIAAETRNRTTAINDLNTSLSKLISNEEKARTTEDTAIRKLIETTSTSLTNTINNKEASLNNLINLAKSSLNDAIRAETTARTSKDTELSSLISSLTASLNNKEKALSDRINSIGESLKGKFVTFTEAETITGVKTFTKNTVWTLGNNHVGHTYIDGKKFGFSVGSSVNGGNNRRIYLSEDTDKLNLGVMSNGRETTRTILDTSYMTRDDSKKGSRVAGKVIYGDAGGVVHIGHRIYLRNLDNIASIGVGGGDGKGALAIFGHNTNNYNDVQHYAFQLGANRRDNSTTMWTDAMIDAPDIYVRSDSRYKTNIKRIENPLGKLKAINGYTYNLIDNGDASAAGVIAQEVKEVFPEIVKGTEEEKYVVQYNGLIGLLIEVVKSQQNQIEELISKVG